MVFSLEWPRSLAAREWPIYATAPPQQADYLPGFIE
jgi:hypothetical protein